MSRKKSTDSSHLASIGTDNRAAREAPTQNRSSNVRLAPLTPDQALAAALRVKPADVKRLEAGEKKAKGKKRGGK